MPTCSRACRRSGTRRWPGHAVAEADSAAARPVDAANAWLRDKQVTDVVGDWARARPNAPPGGWAFQYENAHYPDVDDTAVVGMLLHRQGGVENDVAVARAAAWVVGHAGPRRRLGRVRCGQQPRVPEPHPVRRSWRTARPVDGRRDRALRELPESGRSGRLRPVDLARHRRGCAPSRSRTAAGSAAGAPTTFMGPGPSSVR